MLERKRDRVEAFEEALAAERIEREAPGPLARCAGHRDEIDRHLHAGIGLEDPEELVDLLLGELHQHEPVAEHIVAEDVGEGRRDDGADAEVEQRPGRVLATRAVAEVAARDEDRGAPVGRLVEHEVGILDRLGVVKIAALVKEMHAEALAVDRKQELLRDDLVGVDVGGVERSGNARQSRELVHFCMPPQM